MMDLKQLETGYDAVVMGVSAGGWMALNRLLPELPAEFKPPLIIVQHMSATSDDFLSRILNEKSRLRIKEAEDKEALEPGTVYIAPSNYHLQVEADRSLSLSVWETVNYARPSIDVLFETAADVFRSALIGVLLTGASSDGSRGLLKIRQMGGLTIVQDPETADSPLMPQSAIDLSAAEYVMTLDEMVPFLTDAVAVRPMARYC